MKKIICGLVVFIAAISARAQQPAYPTILLVTAAPSGACTVNLPDEQVAALGTLYTCQSGTWTLIGSGGGGSFNALTGDATSTSTGGATTVKGINGTLLSGLATGPLCNTTSTGVPSICTGPSATVIYASKISGVTPGVAVVPGSSATGTADSAGPINTAIALGNVHLMVDSGFALSTSLVIGSNTWIECTSPQNGFIMQTASNAPVMVNAHQNAPTTASGTGGFLVSNIVDQNIRVSGCMRNANSTQAVTGSGLSPGSVAHTTNPSTGLMVPAVLWTAVNGLVDDHNIEYDAGVYGIAFSNLENFIFDSNQVLLPLPVVQFKFTAGIQGVGPFINGKITNNFITAGDDSIALNADDVNRTGSGSPNLAASSLPGWKWGWVQHIQVSNNTFVGSDYGFRENSGSELIDDIQVTNTQGNVCGNGFVYGAQPPGGTGNMGTTYVNGWNVPTSGTCNNFSQPYNIELNATYEALIFGGNMYANPTVNWPMLFQGVTGGNLSLPNWSVTTASSTFSGLVVTNGCPANLSISGLNWKDSVGSGSVLSGSCVVPVITASTYAGPNLLLAAGYAPAIQNGDAFTNTYAAATYLNTTFNEHTSGTALAGTTPATCSGCTTAWVNTATTWTYGTNLATTSTPGNPGPNSALITTGHANATLRAAVSSCVTPFGCELFVRMTNSSNYAYIYMSSAGTQLFDVVAGTQTQIGSTITGTTFAGNYTVVMSGTAISLTTPNGTTSGTTANTGTEIGMNLFTGSGTPYALTSISLKSF